MPKIAEIEGYSEPRFKRSQIFPTVTPIIVSKTPFKTAEGVKTSYHYVAPSGGYYAVMGEAMNHYVVPKLIFMAQIDQLDTLLRKLAEDKEYPQVKTKSLEKLQKEFRRKPIDPNRVLISFTRTKRKAHYWLSPGEEAPRKMKELSQNMVKEEF